MQFLLNQDELNELTSLKKATERENKLLAALEIARLAILEAHNEECQMPGGICDYCPCSPLGQTGELRDYRLWNLICPLDKDYSD